MFIKNYNNKTKLTNILLPGTIFQKNDVSAKVKKKKKGISDGGNVISINYKNSNNIFARSIRDEICKVNNGLYLGKAYIKNDFMTSWLTGKQYKFVLWFAIQREY